LKKVHQVIKELRMEFIANEYSLVSRNCNHFAEELSMRLLGKRLPSYINRLANAGEWIKFALPQSCKSLNPIPKDGAARPMSALSSSRGYSSVNREE
jgi:hypothetical protein